MKYLILILLVLLTGCASTPYASGAIGYKFQESNVVGGNICSSKISGSAELGVKFKEIYNGTVIAALGHHSQPSCGWPFNDKWEPSKSEAFIRYEKEFMWWWE